MKEVKKFCEKINISKNQFFGKEKISGYLDLRGLTSIPEGFNPTVGGSLDLRALTSIPEGFNPTVGGSLDLRALTSIPEGFNPTVGGSLDLQALTSIPEGFNPTVGGYLDLEGLTSIPEGFNPTVGGYLDLRGLTSIPKGFNPTVGGYLDLRGLTSIPEGFNPTVGGSLYLRGLTSIPEGFNPTVGGSLDLRALTSIPEGFNPTVGGYLDLRGLTSYYKPIPNNYIFTWENGKYILSDGIFLKVIRKKGNIYRCQKIGSEKAIYLITDGNKWSHGYSLKEAKDDLIYKINNRDKSYYNDFTLESKLTLSESIECYRVITGSCSFGVKNFIENRLTNKKKKYTISEIIKVTNGEYGNNEFKKYFEK